MIFQHLQSASGGGALEYFAAVFGLIAVLMGVYGRIVIGRTGMNGRQGTDSSEQG